MRRILAIGGAIALTAAVAVPAVATPEPVGDGSGHKDVVCHATSAEGKWVKIVVDTASAAHAKVLTAHELHARPGNCLLYTSPSPRDHG